MPHSGSAPVDGNGHWRRSRRRSVLFVAWLLALGLAGTGCVAPADRAGGPAVSSSAPAPGGSGSQASPAPDEPGIAGPTDDAAGDPADGCGDTLADLDAVITEQLDAFAADDWDRALSLTSTRFRASGVDADGLREIVTTGYAPAADAERHEVIGCVRTGREAQVLIDVTATDGATIGLVYLMEREDGAWRISGAVAHGSGPDEGDSPIET